MKPPDPALNREKIPGNGGSMSAKARLFLSVTILLGFTLLVYSLYDLGSQLDRVWLWVGLVALTATAGCLGIKIRLPVHGAGSLTVAVGDCLIFAAFLLISPMAGVAIAAIEGIAVNLHFRVRRPAKFLFNIAQVAMVAFLSANAFYLLHGSRAPVILADADFWLLPEVLAAALLYFLLNSGMVATAMALASARSIVALWKAHFPWICPGNLLNSAGAVLLMLSLDPGRSLPLSVVSFAGALLLLALSSYYTRRTSQALF